MLKRWLFLWGRPAAYILATAAGVAGLLGWSLFLARYYSEAPIVAFGPAAPLLKQLSTALVLYIAAGVALFLLVLWLGWRAGREIKVGRRKREAERLFEH
ncbi:MAG: hypothetical protein ACM3RP_13105 [Chitinophagales bacterium]